MAKKSTKKETAKSTITKKQLIDAAKELEKVVKPLDDNDKPLKLVKKDIRNDELSANITECAELLKEMITDKEVEVNFLSENLFTVFKELKIDITPKDEDDEEEDEVEEEDDGDDEVEDEVEDEEDDDDEEDEPDEDDEEVEEDDDEDEEEDEPEEEPIPKKGKGKKEKKAKITWDMILGMKRKELIAIAEKEKFEDFDPSEYPTLKDLRVAIGDEFGLMIPGDDYVPESKKETKKEGKKAKAEKKEKKEKKVKKAKKEIVKKDASDTRYGAFYTIMKKNAGKTISRKKIIEDADAEYCKVANVDANLKQSALAFSRIVHFALAAGIISEEGKDYKVTK